MSEFEGIENKYNLLPRNNNNLKLIHSQTSIKEPTQVEMQRMNKRNNWWLYMSLVYLQIVLCFICNATLNNIDELIENINDDLSMHQCTEDVVKDGMNSLKMIKN